LWPSFIISFVLGSIPIKHKKGMKLWTIKKPKYFCL
jgi:hypothetical protein